MKRTLLFVLLTALYLSAALVPLDKAKKVALNQYGQYCADGSLKGVNIVNVVEHSYEGEVTWYAFEFDKGFVIVTADDAVRPILGYSDHGKVPSSDRKGGENFKEWFGNYDKQIAYARKHNIVDELGRKAWKDIENKVFSSSKAGIVVDRLVRSEWDQGWPWNDSCYVINGVTCPVGPIATAAAQITKFHRWPLSGTGSKRYRPYTGADNITEYFNSCRFDYDLMPEVLQFEYGLYPTYWESGMTAAEAGMLAHHSWMLGFSAGMIYSVEASGATMAGMRTAMITNWFCPLTTALTAFSTPPLGGVDASYATIKAQLDSKRPWEWAGGIHAFILDGYRDDYWYHFNWGWGGMYDGWFHRSALIPEASPQGDYSSGQFGFCIVPGTDQYASFQSTTVSGSIANGEDITVNWTPQTGTTGYEVWRTYNKTAPELIKITNLLTYSDNDLSTGQYSYHVVVKYATGDSHISNSFSAVVTPVVTYPVIKNLSAAAAGRTSIDLSWTKPLTGILNEDVDFEGSKFIPTGWVSKLSLSTGGLLADTYSYIQVLEPSDYSHWFYAYKADGNILTMSAAVTTRHTLWFLSPLITFKDDSYIKWWNRFRYTDSSGTPVPERPVFQIVSYSGDFTAQNYTQIALYNGNTDPENIWDHEETVSLASLDGVNTRVGFRVADNANDLYTLAFDNITIGAETSEEVELCEGYQIYRNGLLAATLNDYNIQDWSDTGFIDGGNEYYLRAIYPTGVSIPSEFITATIDANPKPGYLTATGGVSTQLNWYAPYHNPPKWYAYYSPEMSTTTADVLTDTTPIPKRRTLFKAEDLGYYYPITLDSVALGFFDWDAGNWNGNNTFVVRISTGGEGGYENIIYQSGTLTAVHNQFIKHALTTPIVLFADWNVEVITNSTGYPGTLAAPVSSESTHSYYEYDNGSGSSYDYYMTDGDKLYEWSHLCYITSSAPPPIAKTRWTAPENSISGKCMTIDNSRLIKSPVTSFKSLAYYKIYRNNVVIGTSTSTSYLDNTILDYGDNIYKVTAVYANPPGESDPSNEVVIYGLNPPPSAPANVVTSVVNGNIHIVWDDYGVPYTYNIYVSDNPYGTFTFLATTVFENEFTYTPTENRKFFYITCEFNCKEPPKSIVVPEKKKK